jgi:hypothetical protein
MKRNGAVSQEIKKRPEGYSMPDRLKPPAGVSSTPDMKNSSANLHRLNVLDTYRTFEDDAVNTASK